MSQKNPMYTLFAVKVPQNLGFVDTFPADEFYLRFEDIFDIYHFQHLHPSFVRLFALCMAATIAKEEIPGIAVADPYYMEDSFLHSEAGRDTARDYIQKFMVENKRTSVLLVPSFVK